MLSSRGNTNNGDKVAQDKLSKAKEEPSVTGTDEVADEITDN